MQCLTQAIEARGGQNRRRAANDPDLKAVRAPLEALGLISVSGTVGARAAHSEADRRQLTLAIGADYAHLERFER